MMRTILMTATVTLLTAAPLLAQSERGYVAGVGGFTATTDATSGNALGEVGVRIAPRLSIFGSVGKFHDLQPTDVQSTVDEATAALSASQGLNVIGTSRVPAWYSLGGLRFGVPLGGHVSPYAVGGIGFSHLTPTAQFTYSSGPLPDGSTLSSGTDITQQIMTAGSFTTPPSDNAFMFELGGGVAIPVARHWAADVGYRYYRIDAETPFNANGATFGFGYRF